MLRRWAFVLIFWGLFAFAAVASLYFMPDFGAIQRYQVSPDRIHMSQPVEGNWQADFTFTQSQRKSPELQLYLPSHGGQIAVWLDGAKLPMPEQHRDARINRNRLVTVVDLPPGLVFEGTHQLRIAQSGNYQGAPLVPVYLGPRTALDTVSSAHLAIGPVVRSLIPLTGLFVTLLSALLIFFSSQPRKYILFAAAIIIQVLIEFDERIWLMGNSLRHYAAFMVLGRDVFRVLAFIDWLEIRASHTKWVLRISLSIFAVYAVLEAWNSITNVELFPLISGIYIAETLATAVYFLVMMFKNQANGGIIRQLALGAFAFLISPALAYLAMYDFSAPVEDVFLAANYVNIATALGAFSLVAGALIGEITQYRAQTRQFATMQGIVAGHHLDLDQRSKALKESIEHSAILLERARFTRDMHDGIGGQLLSMLLKARHGGVDSVELERDIEQSIHDLRLVTASLDAGDAGLSAALDSFRDRSRDQLGVAGMELDWQESDNVNSAQLGPRETLDVLRVLQEAITNAIRHSGGSQVKVSMDYDPEARRLKFRVADNGRGLAEPAQKRNGLRNIEQRIARLGGALALVSDNGLSLEFEIRGAPNPVSQTA